MLFIFCPLLPFSPRPIPCSFLANLTLLLLSLFPWPWNLNRPASGRENQRMRKGPFLARPREAEAKRANFANDFWRKGNPKSSLNAKGNFFHYISVKSRYEHGPPLFLYGKWKEKEKKEKMLGHAPLISSFLLPFPSSWLLGAHLFLPPSCREIEPGKKKENI